MSQNEQLMTDAEYARQLQQQEFGYVGQAQLPPKTTVAYSHKQFTNSHENNSTENISDPLLNDNNNPLLINNNSNLNINANPNVNANANNVNNNNNNLVGNLVPGANDAQRARRNVIGSVREADTESPRILLVRIVIGLLEVIATATVLSIGWDETGGDDCNLLKYWVLVYSSRHLITVPLRIHIYRLSHVHANADPNAADNANLKSLQLLRWISIITFLWFLLGQTLLFTGKSCEDGAPTIWYYCLVIIILVYVSLALPFLIVLAICICLPCVLIIFRFFAEPEGADDQVIKKLPTRKVTAQDLHPDGDTNHNRNNENDDDGSGDTDGNEIKNEDDDNETHNDNDSCEAPSCAICMQDYKIGDELRVLPCNHEFHTGCVDKWLPMKKICPLCRHDITKPMQTVERNISNENNNENVQSNRDPPPPYQSLVDHNHNNNNNNNNNNRDDLV